MNSFEDDELGIVRPDRAAFLELWGMRLMGLALAMMLFSALSMVAGVSGIRYAVAVAIGSTVGAVALAVPGVLCCLAGLVLSRTRGHR